MSKRRWTLAIGLFVLVLVGFAVWSWSKSVIVRPSSATGHPAAQAQTKYGVGREASKAEIARRDVTVFPSGAGLPKGRGDAAQGQRLYIAQCAACHGERGEGRGPIGPAIAGGIGSLHTEKPQLTVGSYWPYATTVFDYVRRAMPYQAPGSLTADEAYAVTAYVLYSNGLLAKEQVLDDRTLPAVKMPNRDGFIPDPRPDVHEGASRQSARGRERSGSAGGNN